MSPVLRSRTLTLWVVGGVSIAAGVLTAFLISNVLERQHVAAVAAATEGLARGAALLSLLEGGADAVTRDRLGREVARQASTVPYVVRVKVWTPDAVVRWSDEPDLIGQRFAGNRNVQRAVAGEVAASIRQLGGIEHLYEVEYRRLIEVYVPVRAERSSRVIGVLEVYVKPDETGHLVREVWTIAIAVSLGAALVLWFALRDRR